MRLETTSGGSPPQDTSTMVSLVKTIPLKHKRPSLPRAKTLQESAQHKMAKEIARINRCPLIVDKLASSPLKVKLLQDRGQGCRNAGLLSPSRREGRSAETRRLLHRTPCLPTSVCSVFCAAGNGAGLNISREVRKGRKGRLSFRKVSKGSHRIGCKGKCRLRKGRHSLRKRAKRGCRRTFDPFPEDRRFACSPLCFPTDCCMSC